MVISRDSVLRDGSSVLVSRSNGLKEGVHRGIMAITHA